VHGTVANVTRSLAADWDVEHHAANALPCNTLKTVVSTVSGTQLSGTQISTKISVALKYLDLSQLIGTLSMMLGTGLVFVFTFVPSRTPPMSHVLAFLIPAVSMCAYYSMWAGVWVEFKTTDVTPRVVFWPKVQGSLHSLTLAIIYLVHVLIFFLYFFSSTWGGC
jgi:hypothetical protein